MTRTIQAPGIELREIDKSDYGKEDHSLTSTTVLACGFASKGPNYVINWINTAQNFIDTYGAPETDEERYFYNAAAEVLTKGGVFLGARLPYDNKALTSYSSVDFSLNFTPMSIQASTKFSDDIKQQFRTLDPSLNTFVQINSSNSKSAYITPEALESLRVSTNSISKNTIKIVDITHSQYDSVIVNVKDGNNIYRKSIECLGLVPVITTSMNALFYQGLLSSETLFHNYEQTEESNNDPLAGYEVTTELSAFQPLKNYKLMNSESDVNFSDDNYSTQLTSYSIYDNTVSKQAASYFPTISYSNSKYIDRSYLKQIGVVVFKMFKDTSANETINFQPVEAFIGSLDKNEKDPVTKKSIFIDNVVNSKSACINIFTNVASNVNFQKFDMILAADNTTTSLGLYKSMSEKKIDYNVSIQRALNLILDSAKDTNLYNIDIVCDAGISNIAQKTFLAQQYKINAEVQTITTDRDSIQWKAIVQKFTTFCQNTRKDCMFIADGLKTFALDNDTKIVRRSVPQNTVEKNILPKLKYMTGVNSSYAAGYSVWFQAPDAFSGDMMWLPPSIKAAGIYIFTDIYYNKWDAPAGMARGRVSNVVDCAFSPSQKEAEKLYMQCWNYAVSYPLDGIIMEGQRTFQLKKTAFDRVNVRRLFLHLEKEVSRIAKYFLYEGNTAFLRGRFVDTIRPIFDQAVTRGGIQEFYIKCDEENNTPQTIDNNELHCQIAIKPVKTIEFIILNFICTNQSANVTEIVAE